MNSKEERKRNGMKNGGGMSKEKRKMQGRKKRGEKERRDGKYEERIRTEKQ